MTRTDVHRPSAINPADYDFVGFEYVERTGNPMADAAIQQRCREIIQAHFARTGGRYSSHEHGGNCGVCGNVLAQYTVLFHHRPSNTYVRMGQDCAAKAEMGYDRAEFDAFTRSVRDAREHRAGRAKAEAVLADLGLSRAWELYLTVEVTPAVRAGWRYEESTIVDIVSKQIRYGLTERQSAFIRSLLEKIDRRAQQAAQRAEERANAPAWESGRQEITGTVLSARWVDNGYGLSCKVLLRLADGRRLWTTLPLSLAEGPDKPTGKTVRMTVAVTPAQDDPTMGFGKRPTCAEWIEPTTTPES